MLKFVFLFIVLDFVLDAVKLLGISVINLKLAFKLHKVGFSNLSFDKSYTTH